MSLSIAQARQHMSELIVAALQAPQVITKRDKPVAVLVSTEYFERSEAALKVSAASFYGRLEALRLQHAPQDNSGLELPKPQPTDRLAAWSRPNDFSTAR